MGEKKEKIVKKRTGSDDGFKLTQTTQRFKKYKELKKKTKSAFSSRKDHSKILNLQSLAIRNELLKGFEKK